MWVLNVLLEPYFLAWEQGMGIDHLQPEGHEADEAADRRHLRQGHREQEAKVQDRNRRSLLLLTWSDATLQHTANSEYFRKKKKNKKKIIQKQIRKKKIMNFTKGNK